MKKIVLCFMVTFLSLTFLPQRSSAAVTESSSTLTAPKPAESPEARALVLRLNEIKVMDKSKLNSAEKKNLRKEVKSINHKLREVGGGVYVSAGVLIVVLILLIVLLK